MGTGPETGTGTQTTKSRIVLPCFAIHTLKTIALLILPVQWTVEVKQTATHSLTRIVRHFVTPKQIQPAIVDVISLATIFLAILESIRNVLQHAILEKTKLATTAVYRIVVI